MSVEHNVTFTCDVCHAQATASVRAIGLLSRGESEGTAPPGWMFAELGVHGAMTGAAEVHTCSRACMGAKLRELVALMFPEARG